MVDGGRLCGRFGDGVMMCDEVVRGEWEKDLGVDVGVSTNGD